MSIPRTREPAAVIGEAIEGIFATVAEVRRTTLARFAEVAAARRRLADEDVHGLAPALVDLLGSPGEVAVGLGVILEPGTLASHPLRLEWWHSASGREEPVALEVDLHPDSVGFYDYAAADWFAVPRRTHARHVVGPYVDVHGTDGYMLTFTMPMTVDGRFLGVAGADVPVTRFESLVLGRLGDHDAVLANDEGRVVLSTSSRWITGCLLPEPRRPGGTPLPEVPWELVAG
ncbi:cache domain-containing protein [Nocardioides sp. W7]|uniref:cache domain-containing protein n=1 Tax=Nocardioides sp. W7 TaxID=2931390 RepID=UPI001FD4E25A|nr:cache domain-containing protein [Nocardioides sp. W7]